MERSREQQERRRVFVDVDVERPERRRPALARRVVVGRVVERRVEDVPALARRPGAATWYAVRHECFSSQSLDGNREQSVRDASTMKTVSRPTWTSASTMRDGGQDAERARRRALVEHHEATPVPAGGRGEGEARQDRGR